MKASVLIASTIAVVVCGALIWAVVGGAGKPTNARPASDAPDGTDEPRLIPARPLGDGSRADGASPEIATSKTDGTALQTKDGKTVNRWWVPMSAEEFASSYAKKTAAKRSEFAKYDTDGDGVLSDAERAVIIAAKTMTLSEDAMLRYFDADGDGVLSEVERAEGDAIMAAKNADAASGAADALGGRSAYETRQLEQFDADGDGELNLDEAYAAYLSEVDAKAVWRFRDRYDTNGDDTVDATDMAGFMSLYAEGDERADANDDGSVDERDIEAFEVMMSLQDET